MTEVISCIIGIVIGAVLVRYGASLGTKIVYKARYGETLDEKTPVIWQNNTSGTADDGEDVIDEEIIN